MVTKAIRDKFVAFENDLNSCLIEREEEVRLMLTALVCNEHALLVGAPGSAKSMICDMFGKWLDGGQVFRWLLTKYTQPEELYGPYSIQGIKEDLYERKTAKKLPNAHFAFIDEVFKANSAILNTLLTVMNERTFDNGDVTIDCPLQQMLAASNEWPNEQEELGAMFDRFLFRRRVKNIQTARGLDKLLFDTITPTVSGTITPDEIGIARSEAFAFYVTVEAQDALRQIIQECRTEGIVAGDRRLRKSVDACRAAAWLAGRTEVEPEDLEILQHTLWEDPSEQPKKCAEIVGRIANPVGMKINDLMSQTEEILADCKISDLASATTASAKLQDIAKKFTAVKGNGRATRAKEYVLDEIKRIKRQVVESI